MKTSEILIAAKARIDSPEKWCQGTYYRNEDGVACPRDHARSLCSVGALLFVSPSEHESDVVIRCLSDVIDRSVTAWNDAPERTHPEVMAAFDRAIAIALEKEAA